MKANRSVSTVDPNKPHTMMTLTFDLNDGKSCVSSTDTTVCGPTEHGCGVMFPEMTSEDRKRLREITWKSVTLSDFSRQRSAVRRVGIRK